MSCSKPTPQKKRTTLPLITRTKKSAMLQATIKRWLLFQRQKTPTNVFKSRISIKMGRAGILWWPLVSNLSPLRFQQRGPCLEVIWGALLLLRLSMLWRCSWKRIAEGCMGWESVWRSRGKNVLMLDWSWSVYSSSRAASALFFVLRRTSTSAWKTGSVSGSRSPTYVSAKRSGLI